MVTLDYAYALLGLMFAAFAVQSVRDPSHTSPRASAAFWGLLAVSMLAGPALGGLGNGILVLALVTVSLFTGRKAKAVEAGAAPVATPPAAPESVHGNRLFIPAIAIPAITVSGTLLVQHTDLGGRLVSSIQSTLIVLGVACLSVLVACMIWLRPPPATPLREARRLMDSIGWAALMPQMLAALGAVFLAADVGETVGRLASQILPLGTPFAAVACYCIGMAMFTVIMGNAFAAFPVMTAAIGLPFVVRQFGGDPAIVCAIGMLAGFCGTLLTPMAANFNVVPANLLELPDRNAALNGVIRAQAPTALIMLVANIALMMLLAFRF